MATAPSSALLLANVTKRFDRAVAVDGLSLDVPRGSIYGLLGPNGAGKTTSIRIAMGILRPDTGEIRVLGAVPGDGLERRIGYLPEERGLYRGMKVIENLAFFAGLRGLETREARRRAHVWLERFDIGEAADRKLLELSKGNQQKVQFIATVLHEPELVVLDEPFTGLDPVNQETVRRIILDLAAAGTTVVLSTHLMDEVERLGTHLTLIDHGRALVQGTLPEVRSRYGTDTVRISVDGDPESVASHADVLDATRIGRSLELRLRQGVEPSAFLASIAPHVPVRSFEVRGPSLAGIFMRLVGASGGGTPPGEDGGTVERRDPGEGGETGRGESASLPGTTDPSAPARVGGIDP